MPPDTNTRPSVGEKELWFGGHKDKERLGNYWVLGEVGRGSFATVSKAYRSKSKEIVAIKAVARQKLTSKLLENLESEINILKQIRHKNIVLLEDCFKNDHHIYLVMEYCTGSDLAVYIKGRGRLETLDFVPRPGSHISTANPSAGNKIFWPHPASGGIDERVTRNFLGQLAAALKFLRTMDLIHRDLKPQNLLLHPPSAADLAEGHPLGIPILKVADFGFARILPAAAMAETLCGSPLYMAPEILRYEKYDAKVDLWSVGAVLFEMTVGKAPFRANNHVELLKKIERGEDRIKFPDEGRPDSRDSKEGPPGDPVSLDIKTLIRQLLRRKPIQRMSFDDFFTCGVWDGYMVETSDDGSTSLEASTDSSAVNFESESSDSRLRSMVQSLERSRDQLLPKHAPQPLSVDPALNPQPAPFARDRATRESSAPTPTPPAASPVAEQAPRPIRRTEPKYYVSDDIPASEVERPASVISNVTVTEKANPRPISNTHRRVPSREYGSLDEPRLVTPTSNNTTTPLPSRQRIGEGSPLAATPPMTMPLEDTGKSDRDSGDSLVGRDYVVVEKQNVEVNALADELEQASRRPNTVARRPSSHTSIVTRPVSAFRPSSSSPTTTTTQALIPAGHTPPFALPTTPPFAMQPSSSPLPRRTSGTTLSRPPSYQNGLNIFPPPIHPLAQDMQAPRLSVSPSSLQSGALARALANTALRIYNTGTATAATAIAKATARRRPTIVRTSAELDAQEDEILHIAEDIARKAFVLLELADSKLALWQSLARPPSQQTHLSSTPPFASVRRRSSGSSVGSEVTALRQAEAAISEAVVLYWKAMTIIFRGTTAIQRYWDRRAERYERYEEYTLSPELNEMAQWLRARFNECHEKLEWSKARSADDLPFVDKLVHDHARETSRQAAMAELRSNMSEAQAGYETSLWLLEALLDSDGDSGAMSQDDRQSVEKLMIPIKSRLESLKQKMSDTESQAPPAT